jgi:hypothetical protein
MSSLNIGNVNQPANGPETYISFGISLVGDTFCICITSQPQWKNLLPRDQFPHEITNIIKTNLSRKEICSDLLNHEQCIKKQFDGKIVSGLPLDQYSKMYEYMIKLITSFSSGDNITLEQWTEPPADICVKPIVDLTKMPDGINWILLGKKTKPVIINHSAGYA